MKSTSELTDFYYKTLYPTLEELEKERKELRSRIITVGILYSVIVLFITVLLLKTDAGFDILLFLGFGYVGVGSFIYKFLIKDYTGVFKAKVIEPLIKELDENLHYAATQYLPSHHFTKSKIFTSHPDRMSGNDYVNGKIDGIKIQFSDIHAEKEHRDSKGRTSWSTIFKGLFIVSEFNKDFHGNTIILPDSAQSTFGDLIGNWIQSNNFGRDELVKMDNVDFEKEFVVYSTDQIEARYILSHTLMKKLLSFQKRSKHNIYVSFVRKNINLAIEYDKDLFEPSVFHSLLEYKIAMEYVQTLHLAIGIVEELKLNERLWSKK